jgi:hypothetical protein
MAKDKAVSPLTYLKPNLGVPLDLHAGRYDTTVSLQHPCAPSLAWSQAR